MKSFSKAMVAGLLATVVLSVFMVMKSVMGIMPELDLPRMIAGMMGMPNEPAVGWAVHFMIGVLVYGVALALLDDHLPGESRVWHGVLIAVGGWLIMMVMLMILYPTLVASELVGTDLVQAIRPQVYAKGGDYTVEQLNAEERTALGEVSADIRILPLVPGKSTTAMIGKAAC